MARRTEGDLPPIDWTSFPGLRQPRTTQVPDDLFDWIMPYLTGAELKVLLYIVRRTFGFKKDADAISLDQLCNGILRHDGRRLDLGTGLKRPTVLEALRSLREKQLIIAHPQRDPVTGSRPTVYALRLRQSVAPAPMPTRGSMLEHTPEYVGAGQHGVTGVCRGIPPGDVTAAPQETVESINRQQEESAAPTPAATNRLERRARRRRR